MIEGLAACFRGLADPRDAPVRSSADRHPDNRGLRKIALNLVTRDRRSRASRRGRRKMAAWNDDYMLRIITGQAHA